MTTTTALATVPDPPAGGVATFQPQTLTTEQVELIKRTIAQGTTDDELGLFVQVCNRTQLDPFARQIHAVKRWDGNQRREVMQIQVGIDGFRLIAERTGRYLGRKSIEWCGKDGRWREVWLDDNEQPAAARCVVTKLGPGGVVVETPAVVHFREYAQTKKDGGLTRMWEQMPANQLGKCAEAQALRSAFPAELSGLYTPEEMDQAGPALHLLPPDGFDSVAESQQMHNALARRIKSLSDEQKAVVVEWRNEHGVQWPMSAGLLADLTTVVDRLERGETVDDEPGGSPFDDDDAVDGEVVDEQRSGADTTAAPPSDQVTTRRAQAIHKEAGDLAKLLGHTNSRGNGDSKWADAMLDALILEVTGGRTCSAAAITVTEDSKLGHRMTEVADGRFEVSVSPDFSSVSLQQLSSGHIVYFARDDQGVMQVVDANPEQGE